MAMSANHCVEEVLTHHGIIDESTPTGSIIDVARTAGIVYACLGCASVGGVSPREGEAARAATRDAIDFDVWECCPGMDLIVY